MMPDLCLLAVFAHPDDETYRSGGTLALLASLGVRVQVVTATHGQAGSCGNPPICRQEDLSLVRAGELRCACAALGIETPVLLDYMDGALSEVDECEAVAQVSRLIEHFQPQALLTWPPDGLSGHPDHISVSRWTRLAKEQMNQWTALYYLAVSRSTAEAINISNLSTTADEAITLSIDISTVWEQKMAAILCHQTQLGDSPILKAPLHQQRLFLGREDFIHQDRETEQDYFQNLLTPYALRR